MMSLYSKCRMEDIAHEAEKEMLEERKLFVKNLLKQKQIEINQINKQIEDLAEKLHQKKEKYDQLLKRTLDSVYDEHSCVNCVCTDINLLTTNGTWEISH